MNVMKKSIYTIAVWAALLICGVVGLDIGAAHAVVSHHMDALASVAIGGLTVNAATLSAANRTFKTTFNNAFEAVTQEYSQVAMDVPSNSTANDYKWLGQIHGLREWVGDKLVNNLTAHGYYLKNKDFEDTIEVDRNDIEDDQLGVYTPMLQLLGDAAGRHPDELIWQALVNGFTTGLCFDGLPFFSTSHPIDGHDSGNGVYANRPASLGAGDAWFLMDDSRPIKPLIFQKRKNYSFVSMTNPDDPNVFMQKKFLYSVEARVAPGYSLPQLIYGSRTALDATGYEAARAAMTGLKRVDGNPLGIKPMTLVVGEANFKAANTLVNNERDASGATNPWYKTAKVVKTDYLNGL